MKKKRKNPYFCRLWTSFEIVGHSASTTGWFHKIAKLRAYAINSWIRIRHAHTIDTNTHSFPQAKQSWQRGRSNSQMQFVSLTEYSFKQAKKSLKVRTLFEG